MQKITEKEISIKISPDDYVFVTQPVQQENGVTVDCLRRVKLSRILDLITTNHRELSGRDVPDQHPISAITDLEYRLAELELGYGNSSNNGSASGGLSQTATNLLLTILRDCATYSDQTANIEALEAALIQAELPTEGVYQNGSVLTIISGVNVVQDGSSLLIT